MKLITKDENLTLMYGYLQLTEVKNFLKEMKKIGAHEVKFIIDLDTNEHYFFCYHKGHHYLYPFFRIDYNPFTSDLDFLN